MKINQSKQLGLCCSPRVTQPLLILELQAAALGKERLLLKQLFKNGQLSVCLPQAI